MKVFMSLFALLISVLVSQALSYSYSSGSGSSTIVGDIRIQTLNNGSIYCDSMICPQGTASCRVTKRNDPNNFAVILRHRSCADWNGAILAEQTVYEENTYHNHVNTQVSSGGGGQSIISNGGTTRQMTPQEQRELNEYLRMQQQQIQNQVSGAMADLNQRMRPFLDGSFAANLNNQIRSSMRNSFY